MKITHDAYESYLKTQVAYLMRRRILFIVNPRSGTSKQTVNEEVINKLFDHPNWSIQLTKYAGHARDIATKAKENMDVIVAIGGDGTVNEIASAIIDSSVTLGIIPKGSGNGLSNFLGIPKSLSGAFEVIKTGKVIEIDTMSLNEHHFVNMAGIGFDAHIAHLFKDFGSRGFMSYSKLAAKEFGRYNGLKVKFNYREKTVIEQNAFVLSFANSSQYGNNAHIAPKAIINDGLADVCVIKKFPLIYAPIVLYRMFGKTLGGSNYYNSFKINEMQVSSQQAMPAHVDGEAVNIGKEAVLSVYSRNLRVLIPPNSHLKPLL